MLASWCASALGSGVQHDLTKNFLAHKKEWVKLAERWEQVARDKGRIKYSKLMFSLDNMYHETIAQGHTINMKQLSLSSVLSNAAEIYFKKYKEKY